MLILLDKIIITRADPPRRAIPPSELPNLAKSFDVQEARLWMRTESGLAAALGLACYGVVASFSAETYISSPANPQLRIATTSSCSSGSCAPRP